MEGIFLFFMFYWGSKNDEKNYRRPANSKTFDIHVESVIRNHYTEKYWLK